MANELKHSPTPWRVEKNLYGTANIIETDGRQICACVAEPKSADLDADAAQDVANAAYIVECVNAHDRLRDQVQLLSCESDKLYYQRETFRKKLQEVTKENARLRDLVRRLTDAVRELLEAVDDGDYDALLSEVRAALARERRPGMQTPKWGGRSAP